MPAKGIAPTRHTNRHGFRGTLVASPPEGSGLIGASRHVAGTRARGDHSWSARTSQLKDGCTDTSGGTLISLLATTLVAVVEAISTNPGGEPTGASEGKGDRDVPSHTNPRAISVADGITDTLRFCGDTTSESTNGTINRSGSRSRDLST